MAFEKLEATQVCTWAPPLPQRAFPVQAAGVTSDGVSLGGTAVNGQRYGYFQVNTAQWGVNQNLNLPPLNVGERFQLCSAATGSSFPAPPAFDTGSALPPALGPGNSVSITFAPDLFDVSLMFDGSYTVKDPTLCSVVSTRQASTNSWYVYYAPYNPAIAVVPGQDGLVTVPELSSPRWLGQVGHVANLDYTYAIPGGPDQLTCLLQSEPNYRLVADGQRRRDVRDELRRVVAARHHRHLVGGRSAQPGDRPRAALGQLRRAEQPERRGLPRPGPGPRLADRYRLHEPAVHGRRAELGPGAAAVGQLVPARPVGHQPVRAANGQLR
jgi:hypothetical protein